MILEKLYLIDRNETLVHAWKQCFKQFAEVEVLHGDYFQKSTDAIVSPANSYGIMDGGIDIPLNHKLGRTTVKNLQSKIL